MDKLAAKEIRSTDIINAIFKRSKCTKKIVKFPWRDIFRVVIIDNLLEKALEGVGKLRLVELPFEGFYKC